MVLFSHFVFVVSLFILNHICMIEAHLGTHSHTNVYLPKDEGRFGCKWIAPSDQSQLALWSQLIQTLAANARHTFEISDRSNQCRLPVTPNAKTFSIWGSIYSEILPAIVLHDWNNDAPLGLVYRSLEKNAAWLDAWTTEKNFIKSSLILDEIKCLNLQFMDYIATLPDLPPDVSRPFVRYAIWTTLASLLNQLLDETYPTGCGLTASSVLSDLEIWKRFQGNFTRTVVRGIDDWDELPNRIRRDVFRTLGWALTGLSPLEGSPQKFWVMENIRLVKSKEMLTINNFDIARKEFVL